MKRIGILIVLFVIGVGCQSKGKSEMEKRSNSDTDGNYSNCLFLVCKLDPTEEYGYINSTGDTIIPLGKYPMCYTDTFCTFAIVLKECVGFVGIDRQENALFEVYPFDNGPDYQSDGMLRIVSNDSIGYADTLGNILIQPKFKAAVRFSEGYAAFCYGCKNVGGHFKIGHLWALQNQPLFR